MPCGVLRGVYSDIQNPKDKENKYADGRRLGVGIRYYSSSGKRFLRGEKNLNEKENLLPNIFWDSHFKIDLYVLFRLDIGCSNKKNF